jgi:hypothetical protein
METGELSGKMDGAAEAPIPPPLLSTPLSAKDTTACMPEDPNAERLCGPMAGQAELARASSTPWRRAFMGGAARTACASQASVRPWLLKG